MVVYGDITHDSRVQREANTLADVGHEVTLFCLGGPRGETSALDRRIQVVVRPQAAGTIVPGSPSPFRHRRPESRIRSLAARVRWLSGYARNLRAWGRKVTTTPSPFDVWHVHDFAAFVAIAGSIGTQAALIYDVHDLFVETATPSRLPTVLRWAIRRYERHLMRRVDLAITVNEALATVIRDRYHPRSLIVVHNCPPRWTLPRPRPDLIRQIAGISRDAPVILYHGLLSPGRGIDQLLEAVLQPDLYHAHLALMGYGELRTTLSRRSKEAGFGGRLHILDPVPPADLLPWVASADVGAMAMSRDTLNLYLSTPNKLFECLAAGTPVVVSDFPAVRAIVAGERDRPLGAVCDPSDSVSVMRAILSILDLDAQASVELRQRCEAAARDRWNWELESDKLIAAYQALSASARPRRSGSSG